MLVKCQALLKDRHSSERLLRCWGGHAGLDLKATQASIIQLLQVTQEGLLQASQTRMCVHVLPEQVSLCFKHQKLSSFQDQALVWENIAFKKHA